MNINNLPTVVLNEKGDSCYRLSDLSFHDYCIHSASDGIKPGELVKIFTANQKFAGIGYFNNHSKIPLRILTKQDKIPDKHFWHDSIMNALNYRLSFYSSNNSFRVVYGESDYLPGLVIDKFGDYLSVQITTAGIEQFQTCILDVLEDIFHPTSIVLACNSLPRKKEGLSLFRTTARGNLPSIPFARIDALDYAVNLIDGHKTGFFLDHRYNRHYAAGLCSDRHVLDLFCYSGAFGIQAALNQAASVTCVDIFEPALNYGKIMAQKYTLPVKFLREEAFSFLNNNPDNIKWDVIFLDPPSLVRGHRRAKRNLSNYRKLIVSALHNLNKYGILVSSCCSFHVSRQMFMQITSEAFSQVNRACRIFHFGSQSPDHPVNPAFEGTDYLKCFFIKADE